MLATLISSLPLIVTPLAALWSLWLFIKTRQRWPSAELTQTVLSRPRGDKTWVRVTVEIHNVSKVLLRLTETKAWVCCADSTVEISPTDDLEFDWPLAANPHIKAWESPRQIEPGERDEIHFDFLVDRDCTDLSVYTFFKNVAVRRRELGWEKTGIFSVETAPAKQFQFE